MWHYTAFSFLVTQLKTISQIWLVPSASYLRNTWLSHIWSHRLATDMRKCSSAARVTWCRWQRRKSTKEGRVNVQSLNMQWWHKKIWCLSWEISQQPKNSLTEQWYIIIWASPYCNLSKKNPKVLSPFWKVKKVPGFQTETRNQCHRTQYSAGEHMER